MLAVVKCLLIFSAVTIPKVDVLKAPNEGEQFEHEVPYSCDSCLVDKVYINGIPLETSTRRSSLNSIAFYVTSPSAITIRITGYTATFEGVFQAVFSVDDEKITKTIMEIQSESETVTDATTAASSQDVKSNPDDLTTAALPNTSLPDTTDSISTSTAAAS
ncbi:uncharacterized protein LOC126769588 isoform X2 [Nymphalis io]|uniref:uncharacterized protein LOC126769588 isoform X2 n=1 Tax=Inachis io TaxID=171585 RepID=UPI0021691291|nr:uncharacterized protein LOC126769588 isoform X2 [Nymphalis io]